MIKAGVYTFYSQHRDNVGAIFNFDKLALMTLSVLESRKWFKRLYLFADNVGARILKDELEMPFDFVGLEIENFIPAPLKSFWAMAKVKSYSLMYEPFCHIDNDVILYNGLPDKIHEAVLFGQSKYAIDLKKYTDYVSYFPPEISKHLNERITSYNAGIMGGNNWEFFQDLWRLSYQTLTHSDNRKAFWMPKDAGYSYNQLLEEQFMGILAHEKKLSVTSLFEVGTSEKEALKYSYTHLAGDMKNQTLWKQRVRAKLLERHEAAYYKLEENCKRLNIPINSI